MCQFLCANRLNLSVFPSFPSQKKIIMSQLTKRLNKKEIISFKMREKHDNLLFCVPNVYFSHFSFEIFFIFSARQTATLVDFLSIKKILFLF